MGLRLNWKSYGIPFFNQGDNMGTKEYIEERAREYVTIGSFQDRQRFLKESSESYAKEHGTDRGEFLRLWNLIYDRIPAVGQALRLGIIK